MKDYFSHDKPKFQIIKSLKELFFEFLNLHELILEKKGRYIDWNYFQKHASDELQKVHVKTFKQYRTQWFLKIKNVKFKEYVKINNLYSYS